MLKQDLLLSSDASADLGAADEVQQLWQKSIADFDPEDLVQFVLEPQEQITLFEVINHPEPHTIRGAYYTQQEQLLDVIVQDSKLNIVFMRRAEYEGTIEFMTTQPGEYQFTFSNLGDRKYAKPVTFALHTDEVPVEVPQYDYLYQAAGEQSAADATAEQTDLYKVNELLVLSTAKCSKTLAEIKFSLERQHGHNIDVWKNGEFYLWSLGIETALFFIVLWYSRVHLREKLNERGLGL